MAKYQIAQGSGKGYDITLFAELSSDPAVSFDLVLKNIVEVSGNNSRNVPFFHLQSEVQIQLIDNQNELATFLEPIDDHDIFIEIDRDGDPLLIGNAKLEDENFPVRTSTSTIRLTAHDGLITAQRSIFNPSIYHTRQRLTDIIRDIFDSVDDLPVYTGMTLFHDDTEAFSSSNYSKIYNTRVRLNGYLKGLQTITNYELLKRICNDFNLTIHQQKGAWYLLDNHQRRASYSQLFRIKPTPNTEVSVSFNKSLNLTDLRKKNDLQPVFTPRQIFTSVQAEIEPPSDNDSLLNSDFLQWSISDLFPQFWEYEDPSRYERSLMVVERIRAVSTGMLVRQFIPISSKTFSEIAINLNGSLTFSEDQSTGLHTVRIARIRAFDRFTEYGYNENTNQFSTLSDGYITVTQSYPSLQEKVEFSIDETVPVDGNFNILLELYYQIDQQTAGGLDVLPGFINADVRLLDPEDAHTERTATPDTDRSLNLDLFINENRTYYSRSDIEYHDGSSWLQASGNWNGDTRVEAVSGRVQTRFGGKRTYFDLFLSRDIQINLTDRVQFTFRGTTHFCMPLRVKNYSDPRQLNEVRLLSLG